MTIRIAIFRPPHARNGTMFDRRIDLFRRCEDLGDVEVTIFHDAAYPLDARGLACVPIAAGYGTLPRPLARAVGIRPYQKALPDLARFDVIDTADPSRFGFTAVARDAALNNGVRLVCSSSVTLPIVRAPLALGLARTVLRAASAIVCTTPGAQARFEALRLIAPGDRRVTITGHPIDANRFCPDRTAREPIVLSVCRLDEETGVLDAVDAFASAPESWSWWIVGEGSCRAELEARLAERNLRNRVRLMGRQAHDTLPQLYNRAGVLLHLPRTTDSWEDYFGAVVIEAMACGLPVVARPTGVIPWVAGNAAVLTEGDGGAALRALCTDEERRVGLGERGREHVRETFHIDRVAERLLAAWMMTADVEEPTNA